jgi:hypothetical protein
MRSAEHTQIVRGRWAFQFIVVFMLVGMSNLVWADQAPYLVSNPAAPPANVPFDVHAYFSGIPGEDEFDIAVSGNTITAQYFSSCQAGCPGGVFGEHSLQIPALPVGNYTLTIVDAESSVAFGQFSLQIGIGTVAAVPAPQLISVPSQAPADEVFRVVAFFVGNPSTGTYDVTSSGNLITAVFHPHCPTACPADVYSSHRFAIPALDSGTYTLSIIDESPGAHVLAQFPLAVGFPNSNLPSTQLTTTPFPAPANQAFLADAYFHSFGPFGVEYNLYGVSVSGSVITASINYQCGFNECPIDVLYGPHHLPVPALAPGSYTLQIVNHESPSSVYAQYPLVVIQGSAAAVPVPVLNFQVLWMLAVLVGCAGIFRLRMLRVLASARSWNTMVMRMPVAIPAADAPSSVFRVFR